MRNSTLLFLVKKDGGRITDVCLAMKKRGFGMGRYNGVGGKVESNESIEEAVIRETKEEIGVTVSDIVKRGELEFTFPHKTDWNQLVHVYLADSWDGEIIETEEMNPLWFSIDDVPYKEMWSDDIYWLPQVLEGKNVQGKFSFSEGDVVASHDVVVV